jgi:hypothetical protein
MIRFAENEREYLLEIPIQQKDRAKGIEGRRWDPRRKRWVYPRTLRSYKALLAEFGDEPSFAEISQPSSVKPEVQLDQDRIRSLEEKIREVEASFQVLGNATQQKDPEPGLKELIATKDEKIDDLRKEAERANAAEALVQSELARLKEQVRLLEQREVPKVQKLGDLARAAAKVATGEDQDFVDLVDRLSLSPIFPLEITKQIEKHLRDRLDNFDPKASLFDLLVDARERELLPDEALDLAHTIRRQRNILAHSEVDPVTNPARTLLVLFAGAVLWPYLTQWEIRE